MKTRRFQSFAIGVLALSLAACATTDTGSHSAQAQARLSPGTVLTYATVNAYNGEPRATVRQTFAADGSRIEGMDYAYPSEGGFGRVRATVVNRVLDAEGRIVRLERDDGSSVTYSPPMRTLPEALRPGARFRQQLVATESDGSPPRRVIVNGRASGWETVSVPAGKFDALRVVREVYLGDHTFHRSETVRREIDWYVPTTGLVVRAEENSESMDEMTGGEHGGGLQLFGDWLRWELRSVQKGS